jgi:hypothetical protein
VNDQDVVVVQKQDLAREGPHYIHHSPAVFDHFPKCRLFETGAKQIAGNKQLDAALAAGQSPSKIYVVRTIASKPEAAKIVAPIP